MRENLQKQMLDDDVLRKSLVVVHILAKTHEPGILFVYTEPNRPALKYSEFSTPSKTIDHYCRFMKGLQLVRRYIGRVADHSKMP